MGIGPVLTDIGEKVAGDAIRGFGGFLKKETGSYGFVKTAEDLGSKFPTVKIFTDYLNGTVEQKTRQLGQEKLTQKIASGMKPETAAIDAIHEARQEARKLYIGQNDEALIKAIHTTTKQHGVIAGDAFADAMSVYFNDSMSKWRTSKVRLSPTADPISLKDVGIRNQSHYSSVDELESDLRRGLSWMYTPLIAIPHAGQLANPILNEGISSVAKGLFEYFGSTTKDKFSADVVRSGLLFDELRFQIMDTARGGGLISKLFHHPGFGAVRRFELSVAAAAGKASVKEAAQTLSRDPNHIGARITLIRLGLDPKKLIEKGFELGDDDIQKAMYQAGEQSIFLRNELKTPWRWEQNFNSRMAFQYKQFQYRQTRFLGQVFKRAYQAGPTELAKTVATFATVFPVFGEMVRSLENLSRGENPIARPKDERNVTIAGKHHPIVNEYLDALTYASGFGIFYSLIRAGLWNGGSSYFTGPLFGTVSDVLINLPIKSAMAARDFAQGDKKKGMKKIKTIGRLAASKLGWPGKIANQALKNKKFTYQSKPEDLK